MTRMTLILVLPYVDDIILIENNVSSIEAVMSQLYAEFDMNDLGILHYFLELQIDYTQHSVCSLNQIYQRYFDQNSYA